jgi:hypothetical protein
MKPILVIINGLLVFFFGFILLKFEVFKFFIVAFGTGFIGVGLKLLF